MSDNTRHTCNICHNTFDLDNLNTCDKCGAYCCDNDAAVCEICEGSLECANCYKRCEHCGAYLDTPCEKHCITCGDLLCVNCLGDSSECKDCERERVLDKTYKEPARIETINDAIKALKHYRLSQGGDARLAVCFNDDLASMGFSLASGYELSVEEEDKPVVGILP